MNLGCINGAFTASVLALASALGMATPPSLEVPTEVKPAGEYVRFTPKTDGTSVVYVGLSGLDPFPTEELKDGKRFLLHTRGVAPGRYKFAAVAANKDGEQTRQDFEVVIGNPPVPVPNPPAPNPDPNPTGEFLTAPLYVVVIEETGVRTPAQGKVLADLAAGYTARGQKFKVFDQNDPTVSALKLDALAKATGLPAVVVRDARGIDRAFKLPASFAELDTAVKGLVKP